MGQLTSEYFKDPANLVKLDYIQNDLGVTLKIIHVIRNPYDIIATQTLRSVGAQRRKNSSPDNKVNKTLSRPGISYAINALFLHFNHLKPPVINL